MNGRYRLLAAAFAAVYSALILSFGTYSVVSFWPANSTELTNTTVTLAFRGMPGSFSVGPETLLILIMIIVGAMGACVFSLFAVAHHLGAQKDFNGSWLAWYLVRPFVGAGLSVIYYFLQRGGVLSLGASLQNLNLAVVAGVAGIIGMFSEQALHKLQDLADTLFGAAPSNENAEQLSISNVAFTDTKTVQLVVRNAADTDSSITEISLDDKSVKTSTPPLPVAVAKNNSTPITLTSDSALTPGQQHTIKLKTAKGALITTTAKYNQ